jgi:hypothetical protein
VCIILVWDGSKPGVFCTAEKPVLVSRMPSPHGGWKAGSCTRSKHSVPSERVLAFVLGQCCFKNFFVGILRMCSGNLDIINWRRVVALAMWPPPIATIVADFDSATSTSSIFNSAHFSRTRQIQLLELSCVLLSYAYH